EHRPNAGSLRALGQPARWRLRRLGGRRHTLATRVRSAFRGGVPIAFASNLGMATSKRDRSRLNNSGKVLIVESWVHHYGQDAGGGFFAAGFSLRVRSSRPISRSISPKMTRLRGAPISSHARPRPRA